jgi:hypothetical protein
VGDAAAAKEISTGIINALCRQYELPPRQQLQQLPSKRAAQLSSCMAAALQCAGWLVVAQDPTAAMRTSHMTAIGACMYLATRCTVLQPDLSLLRAVLLPAAGGNVPGEHHLLLLTCGDNTHLQELVAKKGQVVL